MRALIVLGVCWAALLALLAAGGHQPGFTKMLPVAPEEYYAVAAVYVLPLVIALGYLFAWVARAVAGAEVELEALASTWGRVVASLFVLPDLVVFLAAGHGALGAVVRITAPLTALGVFVFCGRLLRARGTGRAVLAVGVALAVQAVPAGLLLR